MVVALAATEFGDGKPVAILHGLFGSARNWASIAQRLGGDDRAIAFDLRNHGASPWAETMSYAEMAEDVRAAMAARGHSRYALIGHSMGGKAAMVLALTNPGDVERLVVVDIAPVAYPVPYLAYVRAMRALDLDAMTRRREADTGLAATIVDPAERAFLLQSLVFGDDKPHWRLNLAALETALPFLAGFPSFPPGTSYDGPALFIAGGRSNALRPEREAAIKTSFPGAELVRIDNAGHWVHAEQPEAFLALVGRFLAS
jgi:pimeloyl-ACP methyl ester carboxylesterase